MLIKQNSQEMFPKWMRFIKGVVDCADISLNVSRETAQDTSMMNKIRDILTNKVLRTIKSELDKDENRYNSWYKDFNQ